MTDQLNRRQFLAASGTLGMTAVAPVLASSAGNKAAASSMSRTDITSLTAMQLSAAIKQGEVSCVETMQAYLERIAKYNPVYNAIVSLQDPEQLLQQAAKADAELARGEYRGWMHGMPHAVKDLSDVRGILTTSGSPILKDNVAGADSIFVERLRNAGAIFIGKTNVPEFGLGSQSYNPVFGVTRNAWDSKLCAGGSSGGAAVGMATHMLPVADGSDMMGSLRNPAAYNNVVGFRPSQGRVPHDDSSVFFQQLGYEGPMGRNVEDTRRLLSTMAGYDARAPLSLRDTVPATGNVVNLKDFKIGWMGDYQGYLPTEPGVLKLCEAALKSLSSHGLAVEDCQPEYEMPRLWQTWLTLRHWTIASGAKALYDNPELRPLLKPEVVWEVEGGLSQTGLDISRAAIARSDWYKALHKLFGEYDFLAVPSAQVFAFSAETHWPKSIGDKQMDTYHRWMEVVIGGTLSGCPVINMPVGFDKQGRAMGMQLIAPMGEDARLLDFAAAYEANTDFLSLRPDLQT